MSPIARAYTELWMRYHYRESGLDNVWLEDGFTITNHPNYGELISIEDADGLHRAIGRWLIGQPRQLTGAERRFLQEELDTPGQLDAEPGEPGELRLRKDKQGGWTQVA